MKKIFYKEAGIKDSDLAEFLYLERRALGGTQSYSKFSNFSELPDYYRPSSDTVSFPLPIFQTPKKNVEITLAEPNKALHDKYIHEENVSFCVHPATLELEAIKNELEKNKNKFEETIECAPLACSRTLINLDEHLPRHSIKVHCPFKISRFYRNLGPKTIRHCITVSNLLKESGIAYLPESIGVAFPTTQERTGWGFIIREGYPRSPTQEKRKLLPCFSLYGQDVYHPNEAPLIVKLIELSKKNPLDYVLKFMYFPIIEDFLGILKTQGILLEAHSQNTLLEIDESGKPQRIVHRDLDNYIDFKIRTDLGLDTQGLKLQPEYEKGAIHSLIYDNSIAHHHFEFLAKEMEKYFHIPKEKIQEACREKFKECLPEHAEIFPTCKYYYSDIPKGHNDFDILSTHQKPEWRPLT